MIHFSVDQGMLNWNQAQTLFLSRFKNMQGEKYCGEGGISKILTSIKVDILETTSYQIYTTKIRSRNSYITYFHIWIFLLTVRKREEEKLYVGVIFGMN
jgi:hypothetical protein